MPVDMTRLTPNAAAKHSGQSRATIIRAIAARELEAMKQRNRWAIDLDDLGRWTAQRPRSAGRGANGDFGRVKPRKTLKCLSEPLRAP